MSRIQHQHYTSRVCTTCVIHSLRLFSPPLCCPLVLGRRQTREDHHPRGGTCGIGPDRPSASHARHSTDSERSYPTLTGLTKWRPHRVESDPELWTGRSHHTHDSARWSFGHSHDLKTRDEVEGASVYATSTAVVLTRPLTTHSDSSS